MSSEHIESFERECSELARLETFDPKAFCEDEKVPQSLCNFVLALSLIFNDLKDLFFSNVLLQNNKPSGSFDRTRPWGNYSGINLHILRLMIGVLHELLNLIDEAKDDLSHPFLREVVRLMPADSREAWDQVVSVGLGVGALSLLSPLVGSVGERGPFPLGFLFWRLAGWRLGSSADTGVAAGALEEVSSAGLTACTGSGAGVAGAAGVALPKAPRSMSKSTSSSSSAQ